jgi:Zn-dependent protease
MNTQHIIQQFIILAPPFLFALTIHEFSHGYIARYLGYPTAENQGRLTLNPLKHIDPMGVICFFLIKIGWAKPIPVDPRYFKNPQRDMLWVSLAGPASNLFLAIASAVLIKFVMLFANVLPSFILFPLVQMIGASIWINIMLAIFNLVPIPPLDGSKILMGLLPPKQARAFAKLEPYGFIILLILFYSGLLPKIIFPIITFTQKLIV